MTTISYGVFIVSYRYRYRTLQVAQMVKNLPALWETQVWSLGQENPLEKGMAAHLSSLSWKIPWTKEPGGLQSTGSQRVQHDWATNTYIRQFSLVQFSRSVVSYSLRPHGLQHATPPCPSPPPGVYSDSCPLSQWCHPTISSSVVPFSSHL